MSGSEEVKEQTEVVMEDANSSMPSAKQEEAAVKKKYGGLLPKKPPLISKDHERAYFDSADWALGKQGAEKPKGPLEALRPKLQPTQQQTRYRKSPYAPSEGEAGQGFAHFYSHHFGGDPISPEESAGASAEGPRKKIRKPYTITKSRENWSEQEHDKFLEAIHLFDRDWKKIEAFVGSKTVIQIRSHAQKYFMKVQKNGTSEHVPPPRPKRKAAHPYPHKAPKKVASEPLSSSALLNSRYALGPLYTWTPSGMLTDSVSPLSKDDFAPCLWTSNEANPLVNENPDEKRAMPDFHQVYSFIGNLFDPSACANASEHLKTLKKMDPITVKTVLVLMKNLSVNLVSPEFENHRMLLSSYNKADTENDSVGSETPATAA